MDTSSTGGKARSGSRSGSRTRSSSGPRTRSSKVQASTARHFSRSPSPAKTSANGKNKPQVKPGTGSEFTMSKDAFDAFPLWLRVGPWSPVTYVYISMLAAALIWVAFFSSLLDSYPVPLEPLFVVTWASQHTLSTIVGVYMLGVLLWMFNEVGFWPMSSYTMISWTLLAARHLLRAVGAPSLAQEILRFPAVAGAVTTFAVWWTLLVPAILYAIKTPEGRWGFLKWNCSPFLVNVHAINLPLCILDHALSPRAFVNVDLFGGYVLGFAYILFYLLALDANGIHFYIIFSPRTSLCCLSFSTVLALYFGIWMHWVNFF